MEIEGTVVRGKGIASGRAVDPRTGLTNTIALQRPCLERAGVPMQGFVDGTVNIDIAPQGIRIEDPDYEVECREWAPGATETFDLVEVEVVHRGTSYRGLIYYPDRRAGASNTGG